MTLTLDRIELPRASRLGQAHNTLKMSGRVLDVDLTWPAERFQLWMVDLIGRVVPLQWTQVPQVTGLWQIGDVTVTPLKVAPTLTVIDWTLDAVRVGRDGQVEFESVLDVAALANDHGLTAERWHCPPPRAHGYMADTGAPSTLTRTGEWGDVTVYRSLPAGSYPRWQVPVDGWWDAAVEVDLDGYTALEGMAADDPLNWRMSNSLLSVAAGSGDGQVEVAHWDDDDAAWVVKTWEIQAGGAAVGAWESVVVLEADTEQATVRLSTSQSPGRVDVDLTLRRGALHVSGLVKRHASATLKVVRATTEAGTAFTGGVRATANDANGNRYVVASASSHTADTTNGGLSIAAVTELDFMVGLEVGGSGAQSGDAAADLLNQHLAPLVHRTQPIRRS